MNPTWEIDKTYKKLFREIIVVEELEFNFNFELIKQSLLAFASGIPLLSA